METTHTTRALTLVGAILLATLIVVGSVHPAEAAWPGNPDPTTYHTGPGSAPHRASTDRYEAKRNLDYRAGKWFYRGTAISTVGECPTEDSCYVAARSTGWPYVEYAWPEGVHP